METYRNPTALGWALKRHVPLWNRNLDTRGRRPCEDGVRDWEWCSGMLRIMGKLQAKRADSPQISKGSQSCWHLGLCSGSIGESLSVFFLSHQVYGTLLWQLPETKAPSLSVCCLPVRWRKILHRWLRNLRIWGFGWLSIALAHFPFFWLDHIKSQPTQIKRAEHLRAHYLLVSKTSPIGLPIEHLIFTHLAVRLWGGALHSLWPLFNRLGSGEKATPP